MLIQREIYLPLVLYREVYRCIIGRKVKIKNQHIFSYTHSSDTHFVDLLSLTQIDNWNFFSSPSSKNDQDETGTADDLL